MILTLISEQSKIQILRWVFLVLRKEIWILRNTFQILTEKVWKKIWMLSKKNNFVRKVKILREKSKWEIKSEFCEKIWILRKKIRIETRFKIFNFKENKPVFGEKKIYILRVKSLNFE